MTDGAYTYGLVLLASRSRHCNALLRSYLTAGISISVLSPRLLALTPFVYSLSPPSGSRLCDTFGPRVGFSGPCSGGLDIASSCCGKGEMLSTPIGSPLVLILGKLCGFRTPSLTGVPGQFGEAGFNGSISAAPRGSWSGIVDSSRRCSDSTDVSDIEISGGDFAVSR